MCEFFCRIQSLWHVWRRLKPSLPTRNTKESHAMSTLRCIFLLCNDVVWSVKAWHRMFIRSPGTQPQWNAGRNRTTRLVHIYSSRMTVWGLLHFQKCLDCFKLREHNLFVQCDQSRQCWWQYSTSWLRWLQHSPVPTWEVSTCSRTQQR